MKKEKKNFVIKKNKNEINVQKNRQVFTVRIDKITIILSIFTHLN